MEWKEVQKKPHGITWYASQQHDNKLSFRYVPSVFFKKKKQEDISFPDFLGNSWVGQFFYKVYFVNLFVFKHTLHNIHIYIHTAHKYSIHAHTICT